MTAYTATCPITTDDPARDQRVANAADGPLIPARSKLATRARVIVSPRKVWVVSKYLENPFAEVFSAAYTGLELAVACTTSQLESTGRNIYGADPASLWMNTGPYGELWEHPVTKANYAWFIARVHEGHTSDGVGPKQLTSLGLLEAADAHGGAWRPQPNCAEGDRFFLALIREAGSEWAAFRDYNGSGPAAEHYADEAMGVVETWRQRLA